MSMDTSLQLLIEQAGITVKQSYSFVEVSRIFGVHPRTVQKWAEAGRISFVTYSKKCRAVLLGDMEAFFWTCYRPVRKTTASSMSNGNFSVVFPEGMFKTCPSCTAYLAHDTILSWCEYVAREFPINEKSALFRVADLLYLRISHRKNDFLFPGRTNQTACPACGVAGDWWQAMYHCFQMLQAVVEKRYLRSGIKSAAELCINYWKRQENQTSSQGEGA